jgi:hypothetical protein
MISQDIEKIFVFLLQRERKVNILHATIYSNLKKLTEKKLRKNERRKC